MSQDGTIGWSVIGRFYINTTDFGDNFDIGMVYAAILSTNMNIKGQKLDGGKRVLVVEADQDFRRYITESIEAEGMSCVTATSVSEALEALARNKVSVLVVNWFLDHVAAEVVRTARLNSPLMPIIVMSGKSYNVRMDALLADADEFLETAIGGSALANRVKRWIGRLEAAPDVFLPRREEDILLLDEVKSRYIRHVVQLVGNNISLAAQKLGVHRQTISAAMATEDVAEGEANNGAEPIRPSIARRESETNDRQ